MTSRAWQRLLCGPATGCRRRSWQWLTGGHNQSSPLTISASLLSHAEHLASYRPTSPKSAMPSRVQEALPADGTRGDSLGHKPSTVQLGKLSMFEDAPSFPKQSRTKVKGDR